MESQGPPHCLHMRFQISYKPEKEKIIQLNGFGKSINGKEQKRAESVQTSSINTEVPIRGGTNYSIELFDTEHEKRFNLIYINVLEMKC